MEENGLLLVVVAGFLIVGMVSFQTGRHRLLYVMTAVSLLLLPLYGLKSSPWKLVVILVAVGSSWGVYGWRKRADLAGRRGRFVGVFCVLTILCAFLVVAMKEQRLYEMVYEAEGSGYRLLRQLSGHASEPVLSGTVGKGNHYDTGARQLTVVVTGGQPVEPVYLKGFSGGDYADGTWEACTDVQDFQEMPRHWTWDEKAHKWIGDQEMSMIGSDGGMYSEERGISLLEFSLSDFEIEWASERMYYMMNSYLLMQEINDPSMKQEVLLSSSEDTLSGNGLPWSSIWIRHESGVYRTQYIPYCSQQSKGAEENTVSLSTYNMVYGDQQEPLSDGYTYRYYPQRYRRGGWDTLGADFSSMASYYEEIQLGYQLYLKQIYLQVPETGLPNLRRLAEEHPLAELKDITAFILYTLQSRCTYTKTPGRTPVNQDVVEYFLFENRQGYCEQFAAAGTLLYRLYGIPARYATGYMVAPENFTEQEDGTWLAEVTDESAHAWVEIFLKDYGWIPVDVTPDTSGNAVASYPGFDGSLVTELAEAYRWNADRWGEAGAERTKRDGNWETDIQLPEISLTSTQKEAGKWMCIAFFLETILLLPVLAGWHRMQVWKRVRKGGCRRIYSRLVAMLHASGVLTACTGEEEDFLKRCVETLPALSREEAGEVKQILLQAAYGADPVTEAQEDTVVRFYRHVSVCLQSQMFILKRVYFKYGKCF